MLKLRSNHGLVATPLPTSLAKGEVPAGDLGKQLSWARRDTIAPVGRDGEGAVLPPIPNV